MWWKFVPCCYKVSHCKIVVWTGTQSMTIFLQIWTENSDFDLWNNGLLWLIISSWKFEESCIKILQRKNGRGLTDGVMIGSICCPIGKKRIVIMGTRTIFAKHNAYGYFLETLNMTLNLFERFLMDCNFDLTPLVAVVITENLLILLLRAIDWNVQSDLVCVREKPLVKR